MVDDEEVFLNLLNTVLLQKGFQVMTAQDGITAINRLQTHLFDLVLLDVKMPRVDGVEVLRFIKDHHPDTQVLMVTGADDVRLAVECMKLGAYDYLTKPYASDALHLAIDRALERKRLVLENKALKNELARHSFSSHIIGQSKSFAEVLSLALRVAPTDSTVLLQGPSGTGKELIARFLHQNSLRKDEPFVALDCASIPDTLMESELFGHEKGAFTDAITTKQGLVEIANNGTLFLDEVGEISPIIQPKLLRFLQTGEYRRLGGNKNYHANVRVISATNKDLRSEVAANRFREDLLYRLNVITLSLPALRERREDIPLLVKHFLKRQRRGADSKSLDSRALDILMKYDWPGNVRELENVIEQAAILSRNNVIEIDDLALPIGNNQKRDHPVSQHISVSILGTAVSMREIEKAHIDGVLKSVGWNKNTAAKILGISLKTLYTKIQQFNLSRE